MFWGTNWVLWLLSIRTINLLTYHCEQTRLNKKVAHWTEILQLMMIRSAGLSVQVLDYEVWDNTSVVKFELASSTSWRCHDGRFLYRKMMQWLNTYSEELQPRLLQVDAMKHFVNLIEGPRVRMLVVQAVDEPGIVVGPNTLPSLHS